MDNQPAQRKGIDIQAVLVTVLAVMVICFLVVGGMAVLRPRLKPAPTPTVPSIGKWQTNTSTSSFDDSQTVAVFLFAENSIQGWLDTYLPILYVRCKEHKLEVYINLGGTVADVEYNTDQTTVRLRFDKEQAFQVATDNSTDDKAVFFQTPQQALTAIMTHETMVFGFTPLNSPPVETSFDLQGAAQAAAPVIKACQ